VTASRFSEKFSPDSIIRFYVSRFGEISEKCEAAEIGRFVKNDGALVKMSDAVLSGLVQSHQDMAQSYYDWCNAVTFGATLLQLAQSHYN
jgi:hypothetical protein